MAVVEQIWIEPENRGLLAVLYPGIRVLKDPFPSFLVEQKVILVTEREVTWYLPKEVTVVTRRANIRLDKRDELLTFVRTHGVSCSAHQEEMLMHLEEGSFQMAVKIAMILKHFPSAHVDSASSTFQVFNHMFESFDEAYLHYKKAAVPHRVVFSSLMTMMLKTQNLDAPGISPGYKRVLMKNVTFYNVFRREVADYLESSMSEQDFLTLLAGCSAQKRGQ